VRLRQGGQIEEIRPGDMVWFATDERHWHGATDKTAMMRVAITGCVDGSAVTWLEPVTDAGYLCRRG
jgi:quercetin dioxygenase-like cupin family protein